MNAFLDDVRRTLAPARDSKDGLLPPLLVALTDGRLAGSLSSRRELLLGLTAGAQAVLLLAAVIIAAVTAQPVPAALRCTLIVLLSAAMGAQNATARKLAVPDLTTTVLTLTITGVAADSPLAGATGAKAARRLISVAAMLLGALVGALLVMHVRIAFPLAIALLILVAVALAAIARSRVPLTPDAAV